MSCSGRAIRSKYRETGRNASLTVDRRVAERLDLLEDRVGRPSLERIARQQQDRDPVRMCDAGGGHHVQGPWTDRRRRDHGLAAIHRLGETDGREGHALFRVAAPCRQLVSNLVERAAEAEHVAVPEDGEDAGEQRNLGPIEQLGALRDHPPDQRLRGREAHGVGGGRRPSPSGVGTHQSERTSGLGRTMSRTAAWRSWYPATNVRRVRTVGPKESNSSMARPSGS